MNSTLFAVLVDPNVKLIEVVFDKDSFEKAMKNQYVNSYVYKTVDSTLQKGDYVIVPDNSYKEFGSTARVINTDVLPDFDEENIKYRWIVGKSDRTEYDRLVKNEEMLVKEMAKARIGNARVQALQALGIDPEAVKTLSLLDMREATEE